MGFRTILADVASARGILIVLERALARYGLLPSILHAPIQVFSGVFMISRERVQAVIERIRPLIQGDGGDIELVDVVDNKAKVRLTGNCVGCPSAQMTLFMGVEMAIKEEIPEFEELQVV